MLAYAMSGNFGAAASGDVLQLQQALKAYSIAAADSGADPQEASGIVGVGTIMAVADVAGKIKGIPSDVGSVLTMLNSSMGRSAAAFAWSVLPANLQDQVTQTITHYAKDIAVGVLAAAALFTLTSTPPTPPPGPLPALFALARTGLVISPNAPAAAGKYKTGSMTRFNVTRKVWSVYSPLAGAGLFGLSVSSEGRCMGGDCLGAAAEVNPPVPMGFVKAGEELVPPTGVTQAGAEEDKSSLFKNPYFWLAVGGGVVALGTGGYFLLRKPKAG